MSPELVGALVRILEVKDGSTAAHTWRVVLYTRAMAEEAGVDKSDIARLTTAAALHDVGKIEVPDEILLKPGPLSPSEYKIMQTHAALGHEQLLRMGEDDPIILDLVRHHHERMDGKGYPDGLTGPEIPDEARMFAVIDSFDAMTSIRPYRHEVGPAAAASAIEAIRAEVGTRYCDEHVERLATSYKAGRLNWILEYFNDSCPVPSYDQLSRATQIAAP
ncbi:MAG: HD domain-containing phosphohydrolase [Planctomycetota bacterium]